MKNIFTTAVLLSILICACKKEKPIDNNQPDTYGKIEFKFFHKVDGLPLVTDTLKYINEAGNLYEVNEIQYFISDVVLHRADGSFYNINQWQDIHYVDTDIPATQTWNVFDKIPDGNYSGISFTFGINAQKNQSFMFVNPPESFMFWPDVLGGGYHYMKLNGKWQDPQQQIRFFNFHLGIGQIYGAQDTIYVHNHFQVNLPNSAFTLADKETKTIGIIMNIENWFKSPNIYDHNFWGGDIMENQDAMQAASENGHDVFSVDFGCCNK
ncbi:MAG: hypothetical protein PHT69_12285 [Bacteroidales bacterium]|nr:hypothetical protein [Bacteroidales bacterium]